MKDLVAAIGLGGVVFVSTNIDDILLLATFFADPALARRQVVAGQFIGMGALVAISAVCGLLGTARGNHVELAFLRDWSARDTVEYLTGELRGDTIVGSYRGHGGVTHFVRQPPGR